MDTQELWQFTDELQHLYEYMYHLRESTRATPETNVDIRE